MKSFFQWSFPLYFLLLIAPPILARTKSPMRRPATPSHSIETASADASYLQRILYLENQRLSKDKFLIACLSHSSRRVVKAALLALGRIGDTSALDEMASFLSKKDSELGETAAFALSIIGGETAPKILHQSLVFQKNPTIRAAILLAIGRVGLESGVSPLSQTLLKETDQTLLEKAAEGLALLWSGPTETWPVADGLLIKLVRLSQSPEPLSTTAAAALSRFKGDPKFLPVTELLEALPKTTSPSSRALMVRVLNRVRSPQAALLLTNLLLHDAHIGVRIEAASALRNQVPTAPLLEALKTAAISDTNRGVAVTALNSLGKYGGTALATGDALEALAKNHPSLWVRTNALKNLARIAPDKSRPLLTEWVKNPAHPLFSSVIATYAVLGTTEDLEKISPLLPELENPVVSETIEEMTAAPEDKVPGAMKTTLKRLLLRNDMGLTALIAQLANQFKWKDFATLLASSYGVFTREDHVEVKVGILNALGTIGETEQAGIVESATNDKDKLVVVAAVNALKQMTGKDLSQKIPLNSKINSSVPNWQELTNALNKRMVLKTTRGDLTIKMLPEGAVSAYQLLHLASTGFYDGKTFHRVVPNFVAQGGDPRGDGFGGPGYLLRDEVSPRRHLRGTVGVATAGRDTGGCQFFINTAPNLHLAGKYTLFAEIVSGIDLIDTFEVGDKILGAQVK